MRPGHRSDVVDASRSVRPRVFAAMHFPKGGVGQHCTAMEEFYFLPRVPSTVRSMILGEDAEFLFSETFIRTRPFQGDLRPSDRIAYATVHRTCQTAACLR